MTGGGKNQQFRAIAYSRQAYFRVIWIETRLNKVDRSCERKIRFSVHSRQLVRKSKYWVGGARLSGFLVSACLDSPFGPGSVSRLFGGHGAAACRRRIRFACRSRNGAVLLPLSLFVCRVCVCLLEQICKQIGVYCSSFCLRIQSILPPILGGGLRAYLVGKCPYFSFICLISSTVGCRKKSSCLC